MLKWIGCLLGTDKSEEIVQFGLALKNACDRRDSLDALIGGLHAIVRFLPEVKAFRRICGSDKNKRKLSAKLADLAGKMRSALDAKTLRVYHIVLPVDVGGLLEKGSDGTASGLLVYVTHSSVKMHAGNYELSVSVWKNNTSDPIVRSIVCQSAQRYQAEVLKPMLDLVIEIRGEL